MRLVPSERVVSTGFSAKRVCSPLDVDGKSREVSAAGPAKGVPFVPAFPREGTRSLRRGDHGHKRRCGKVSPCSF